MSLFDIINRCTGIACHSDQVKEGYVFFAIPGNKVNGEDFISHAIEKGAKFIVLEKKLYQPVLGVEYFQVDNIRKILSKFSSLFYSKQPINVVGVTGTNGKTSVVHFFQQICHLLGKKSASIGTLGVISENHYDFKTGGLTSASPVDLHYTLDRLSRDGYTHVALEASSHGIDQHRLDNVNFKAVGFTNFSQDHLDYHKNMELYFTAKVRLFKEVLKKGYAVLNKDIKEYNQLRDISTRAGNVIIDYGYKNSNLRILDIKEDSFYVQYFDKTKLVRWNIRGNFQLYNFLCAAGLLSCCGIEMDDILSVAPQIKSPRGRLELCGKYNGADVYIDYAHTPDSLLKILLEIRKFCYGVLYLVFGCGGERDVQKRFEMGKIAKLNADCVVVTDDNPRNDNPKKIRSDILSVCDNAIEIGDRAEAIKFCIKKLKKNDVLLIAGKGHEEYQIIGDKKIYFSDFDIVNENINR